MDTKRIRNNRDKSTDSNRYKENQKLIKKKNIHKWTNWYIHTDGQNDRHTNTCRERDMQVKRQINTQRNRETDMRTKSANEQTRQRDTQRG